MIRSVHVPLLYGMKGERMNRAQIIILPIGETIIQPNSAYSRRESIALNVDISGVKRVFFGTCLEVDSVSELI